MTERVRKTQDFLRMKYDSCGYFEKHPDERKYRWEHSVRVANLCGQIARDEGLNEEAAVIAGLLHDVGYGQDFPADYNWNEHGRDGARFARPFLETLGLDGDTVNDICYAIAIHVDDKADFEGRRTPFTETVGDADNIDRFDTWRIYESVRWQMQPEEHTLEENLAWLRKRLENLERLGKMNFGTPTATRLWLEKLEFQTTFFTRMLTQLEGSVLRAEREESV